ncbi:hypothetical protein FOXB_14848 [Fusarium oxysporum f. sp. conglutinans Fo5176]|uniref:Aldehyde dehydrogenase domain-containing protein n=1 Tax=Fusarium oxysporum (strain Fo5176) TaxID=660025 RepID=F9G866_FUSOF|nr:hypothetical protein FOXB_14848 [Fusarium oxysporum f. sp. conglutinans Fo5176]
MASISATELPKQLFINNAFVDSKSNKTRVYVQEGLYDEFIAACRDAMEARAKEFGDVNDPKTRFGPLVDKLQYDQECLESTVLVACFSTRLLVDIKSLAWDGNAVLWG